MNTRRIKVLHVAECVGGVDVYLHSLIKYMNREVYENILVISQLYDVSKYAEIADHIEVVNIKHGMGLKTLASAVSIRRLIKKYNPDIVYAHSSVAGAVTRLGKIGLRNKCVYNPHGWSFNMQSKKRMLFIGLERIMAHFCDKIICISEAEKKAALENKICDEDMLEVINNGIETGQVPTKTRTELGLPENAFIIGMVGRICKQKAPDTFIRMAEYIKDACFVIVGDILEGSSDERDAVEALAKKYGAQYILTGWIDNAFDYIGAFDVACLLSRWEGFGLVLPEYMLCGKPIVATNVDAIPYIIKEGYNGLLVDVDDYKSAAKAVMRIREDPQLRENLIQNGLNEVYQKFDIRRVAEEHDRLFAALSE